MTNCFKLYAILNYILIKIRCFSGAGLVVPDSVVIFGDDPEAVLPGEANFGVGIKLDLKTKVFQLFSIRSEIIQILKC